VLVIEKWGSPRSKIAKHFSRLQEVMKVATCDWESGDRLFGSMLVTRLKELRFFGNIFGNVVWKARVLA
jgi:hypothetical protein